MADVADPAGAQKRVAYGMEQDVGVGMAAQSLVMGDHHSSQNQFSFFYQRVYVVSVSDPEHRRRLLSITQVGTAASLRDSSLAQRSASRTSSIWLMDLL